MRVSGIVAVFMVMLSAASLCGCDLFATRPPDSPLTSSTFIWTPATSIDLLRANFTGSLNRLDNSNYGRVFISATDTSSSGATPAYVFVPRPGLDAQSQAVFADWDVRAETACVTALRSALPKDALITIKLTDQTIDQSNSSSATLAANYDLAMPADGSSIIPRHLAGHLVFSLQMITTVAAAREWRIVQWSDFPGVPDTLPTWTDLKLALSS